MTEQRGVRRRLRAARPRACFALLVTGLLVLGVTPSAAADPKPLASMSCRLEAGSGRLLCTVSLSPPAGRTIAWSDALVMAAPGSARALRSRVTSKSDRPAEVVLAFVVGSGEGGRIAVLARAVTCPMAPQKGECTPVSTRVGFDWKPAA